MQGRGSRSHATSRGAAALTILMLAVSFSAFIPTTSAAVSGDLSIIRGIEPIQNATYDRDTSFIMPSVIVKNDKFTSHSNREIRWQICSGDHTSNLACPANSNGGLLSLGTIYGFQQFTVNFTNYLYQPSVTGIHTAVYFFPVTDSDTSDDRIAYTFNVAAPLRDLTINSLDFDDSVVYNSNVSYPMSAEFYRRSWEAGANATFGWELSFNGTVVGSEQQTIIPPVATDQRWTVVLPNFTAPFPGEYTLSAGLLNSDSDMNDWNNLITITVRVNDSIDAYVVDITPARGSGQTIEVGGQNNTLYPMGEDAIRVSVGNQGNLSVNTSFSLSVSDMNGTLLDGPNICAVILAPAETAYCDFDLDVSGELLLRAEFSSGLDGIDVAPANNWYEAEVSSRHAFMYPTVSNPVQGERFDSGDQILFIGQISPYAATPVNFTWRLNYEETIGYGQIMNTSLPMGEWLVTLTTRDSLGRIETGVRTIRIQNRISLVSEPWVTDGESVMDEEVNYHFSEPEYPPNGFQYTTLIDEGISPLRVIEFDIEPAEVGVLDAGIQFIDARLSLTDLIPDDLDRTSLKVYRMESRETTQLTELTLPNLVEIWDEGASVHIYDSEYSNGIYMIAGDLQNAEVSVNNLTTVQMPRGALRLEWQPSGDLDNPYFGGWRVYRRISFPFFWPYENESQFYSVIGTEMADLNPYDDHWEDPLSLPDGTCVSYLVMAIDRQGQPDHSHGAAAGWNGHNVEWQCGDAVPPIVEVNGMSHEVTFDNSSGQNIHHVNLSWAWPEYGAEDNLSWNLYRVEQIPSDLTWVEPLVSGLWGEPGTTGRFHEKESPFFHGIEKEHTYHYILVPMDDVGNIDYTPLQGNIETVEIGNQFWDHNSYLIPEPPPEEPPPYGIAWLGEFMDYYQLSAFRTSILFAFSIVLLNIVIIPVVINQTRGVRRRIRRQKARVRRQREMEMADDMADDLEDFFG